MDDSSDSLIRFDSEGHCSYCNRALEVMSQTYFPGTYELGKGNTRLDALISKVKKAGVGHKYDCVMGLSGGLDSSYLAYLGHKWGLRVLAIHIDDGYDTEISRSNLKKLIEATGFDYEVIKPDPEQYNALNLAYLRSGVPNIAIPQDNILFAFLYSKMREYGIKYFLSGGNFALECILQADNTYKAFDMVNTKDIHKRFGTKPIDKLVFLTTTQRVIDNLFLGIESPRPLNYVDYNRKRAFEELDAFCGFKYYGRKHLENIWTAFAQLYWFPKKFGVDKRTSHLSSMIISGQMTREEALKEYSEPLYDEKMMAEYIGIVKDKLHITDAEFEEIMLAPSHQHTDYKIEDDTFGFRAFRTMTKAGKYVKRLFSNLR